MEFKKYLQILKGGRRQIFLTTLTVTLLAFLTPQLLAQQYEINFSVYITKKTKKLSQEFEYDQYYALKAKEKLGKFIEEYLKNPAVKSKILTRAEISSNDYFLPLRRHFFQAYSLSSQEVQVNFKMKNPNKAEKVATETLKKLNAIFKALFSNKDQTQYQLKRSPVALTKSGFSPAFSSLLGATGGIFLGIFIVLFRHYLN